MKKITMSKIVSYLIDENVPQSVWEPLIELCTAEEVGAYFQHLRPGYPGTFQEWRRFEEENRWKRHGNPRARVSTRTELIGSLPISSRTLSKTSTICRLPEYEPC
jgi:hypothetical protein